ncbi:hypothetical protein FA95DRAFT_1104006 [Auriscalpium vulgare]|uniref:Uncharacterized protein n=1 Tax=Auriscalpium vulgare TaxID=40419 RepID=A0ACB8R4J2_9AGAM|nr:hypothetical protein FA95DRAFT_1104006 [Auriscalpium vulgare]
MRSSYFHCEAITLVFSSHVLHLRRVGPTLRLPRNEQADHRLHPLMGWAMHVHDTKWGPHQRLLAAGRKALLQLHNDKQGDYTAKLALESAIRRNFARRHHRWILQDFAGAEARNSEDPLTGFCDSLCVVEIPSAIPADLLKSFEEMSLIVNPTQASMAAPADEGDHHARSAAAPTLSTERLSNSIRLPLLLSQYRQRRGPFHVGATKLRMNLTAAVKYLAALDIWNFAVFGLLTKGTAGVVVAAWAVPSTENRPTEVHILERSCCAFNLATPLGAFHYATFLSWLQLVHGKNLLEAFDDGKRQAFLERLEKGHESIQWAMRPQLWEPDSEAPDDSDGSDDSYD